MLFYGPSGAGKKTLVLALLREIYGPGVERIKVEAKQWKIDVGSRKVEVDLTLLSSNHHVEMNPSDVGMKDRYIVQEVIKEMARARPIGVDGAKGYKGKRAHPRPRCRPGAALTSTRLRAVLVLNEVDKLSKEAQHALRRTMEKYSGALPVRLLHGAAAGLPPAAGALSVDGRRRGVPPDSAVQQHLARARRRPITHAARARGGAVRGGDLRRAAARGGKGENHAARRVRCARRCGLVCSLRPESHD